MAAGTGGPGHPEAFGVGAQDGGETLELGRYRHRPGPPGRRAARHRHTRLEQSGRLAPEGGVRRHQLDQLERSDRDLSWLHFLFLAIVTVMPFTTQLLAEFITFRVALFLYWTNLVAAGLSIYACWAYSERAGLTRRDLEPAVSKAIRRRIVTAQALYALGAVIGYFDPPVGVGAILLTQLNYAIAPRLPFLSRL